MNEGHGSSAPVTGCEYRGRRVIVLGAAGFIGRWTSRRLSEMGARLHIVLQNIEQSSALAGYDIKAECSAFDLTERDALTAYLERIRPAVVFNLAGYGVSPSERDDTLAYRVNADLPAIVCNAVAEHRDAHWQGQSLVHVGSALEYGTASGSLAEESEPRPTTLYGQSKLAGTKAVQCLCASRGVRGVTARLFMVYGPGERPGRLFPSLLATSETDKPLPLTSGLQRRDFTYVEDVAEGLLRLGACPTAGAGQIVNLATGKLRSVREFVETVADTLNVPRALLGFGALPTRDEEMCHDEVDIRCMRRLINWAPRADLAECIRKAQDFQRVGELRRSRCVQ